MRTVSFSNPELQRTLNNHFVNTFTNTHGDPTAGKSIKHSPNESPGPCIRGNGKQNVQSIFMTADGEIIHVATGYQSADDLIDESKFALALFNKIKMKDHDQQRQIVVAKHRSRLDEDSSSGRSPLSEFDSIAEKFARFSNPRQSKTRNGRSTRNPSFPGMEMMNGFVNGSTNRDQQFSIEHPMLTHKQLEANPAKLVGNGSSFFASSGFGTDAFEK